MSESPVDQPIRIFFFAAGSMICFSIMNLFVKLSAVDYSIAQIIFFRNILAFPLVLYMIYRHGGRKLFKTENHLGHFQRALVGLAAMTCFFTSFALLPLTNATSIHFASPLILTALSVPLLKERVGLPRWSAVIVGLFAILFMLQPAENGNITGNMVALMAAFLGALAMISVRKLGRTDHALTIVFYFTIYGSVAGAVSMFFMWQPLQSDTFIFLVLTGLIGGIAQIMLTYAYTHAPAAYVAPFSYMSICLAVVFDIMLWQKYPDGHIWIGSTVIICSGLFIVYREARKKQLKTRTNLYGLQPSVPTKKDETEPL